MSANTNDCLLNERQVSLRLGVTPSPWQAWRYQGRGPQFLRLSNRCVRYRACDINAWLENRLIQVGED